MQARIFPAFREAQALYPFRSATQTPKISRT